ncbi:hypothetical protein [Sandaracinobacteroides saxicola]|uniref:Uncharacterized protein n=1 Tax=Sandaracinobacteroides saxicola TaxID=2759707 RepID=A0A7G5IH98_9SPHN|nr:hypothetical protein [Sandaracinobacteroides saxicola]QMW22740.1 hypothetical protein H3309_15780 [Sandaracinobacteroides saxicola]
MRIERRGDEVVIAPLSPERLNFAEMVARMRKLGVPADGVQAREPFEYPERPGLFD